MPPVATAITPASESALLTSLLHAPIECYPSAASYSSADRTVGYESAGYYGYSPVFKRVAVNLSPSECGALQELREGATGTTVSYAVFVLSHELAHATGDDYAFESTHESDPAFERQVAAIQAKYPARDAPREAAADCVGLSRSSAIAYQLGMRGHRPFALLAKYAALRGYAKIPAECASGRGLTIGSTVN